MRQERILQDGFAGAGFAEHQTESTLLGMHFQDVEPLLSKTARRKVILEGDASEEGG